MSKKKAPQPQKPPHARRKWQSTPKAIITGVLLLSITVIVLTQWQSRRTAATQLSLAPEPLAPQPPQTPTLSKEYIYAGDRLVATEEQSNTATATFIKTDTTTQGNWKGKYGADGYNIINDAVSYPAYAQVAPTSNLLAAWSSSTSDVRALQKVASTTDRLAACWYQSSYFTIDINITDGQTHQIAIYALDWDGNNARSQQIDMLDATTNTVLDSRSVTAFSSGKYVVWHVSGHLIIKMTRTGTWNSVISGLFFDPTRTNVALASSGAVASASSIYNASYVASGAINGEHRGLNYGSGGVWHSGAPTFPQWVQIDFNSNKTIDEIDVFTAQNNYANPSEPTETMTFTLYGLTAFDVQFWNGTSWATVPGGSVTGNDKVWRKLAFSPITTSKIRIWTNASVDGWSRIAEVEAWGTN